MKWIAVLDEDFISNFRVDMDGINLPTMVVRDNTGFDRGISLKPLTKEMFITQDGESIYLSQDHIDCLMNMEREETINREVKDILESLSRGNKHGTSGDNKEEP